ncbi:uncharacterized protein LOC111944899 [Cyanistes caeruleus]|uniref:uncharacterized protein LOC111944899 n=1 Tax=Cyanistes caeruleus TaxID=156563 RepID=UPI000CDA9502|nr:uncharacterized protein LOC111944899 [Cyanistes caeruleus]
MEQRPPRVPKLAWLEEEEEEGSGAVLAQESEEVQEFQAPQEGWESPKEDREQRPPRVPKLAWVEEEEEEVEEEGPGAAPAPETEEVQQLQPLEEDAAMDGTQEQDTARGRFRRAAQFLYQYITRIGKEDTRPMDTEVKASSEVLVEQSSAAQLDLLVETALFNPEQVPGVVRYIHQWLMANEAAEHRMDWALMQVAEAEPDDVAITLLRVAPTCDRAAMAMWTTILLSPWISEEVTPLLINVVGSWPQKNLGTSDGDKTAVFSLTATLVMWKILQGPCCPQILTVYFPRLFVHLLFQTYFSTLYMTEDVHTFWKECQEQHGLSTSPSRCSMPLLLSLPLPQPQSQRSQRHLGFAVHTGLQCRP